ncbi:endolytic transglycosylase MltG [Streptomyces litchfieldiae]|uniref:Endolytic murein transglycosylase n=1 Tax=Streptomyces litchfieldiae TaxID=3075543 RepID=A0ABU2MQS8_9ACTN|nr:endolytic transglycosylase MltG [Streptomyces sp. DSM 44938]MDT0343708.1 endolytic transglycosylase MltG [Streptomyces sp. DSM 44938]
MTEYGRGSGSEPWYPEDPLHGDPNWSGGYDGTGAQPGAWEGQYGAQQQPHHPGQHAPQQHQEPHYPQQYGEQGGWDTTGQYYADPSYPQAQSGAYPTGEYQDAYGTQEAYPAPQPQHLGQEPQHHQHHQEQYEQQHPEQYEQQQRHAHPQQGGHQAGPRPAPPAADGPGPDPETGWDPGPDQGEHDFFSRDDDDEDDRRSGGAAGRAGRRGERPKRRRGGCGCMVAALIVVGGLGGVAYYGYQFYQDRFGPAPDYAGEGTGEVQVEIPEGSSLSMIGNILKEAGVVRSHDAFVEAAGENTFQAGVFNLREQMSAASAVELLLDPAAVNALIIPEGRRATEIYTLIDEYLGLEEGSTEEVADSADLGLPDWAEGNPEGFLFPTRYDVGADTTPEELLTEMVDRAEAEFAEIDLEGQAAEIDRTPREVLTIASLIEAEAQSDEEFVQVSRVIYNRLEQDIKLQFDSTINYALGRSTLDTSIEDTQLDSPYNTYVEFGLPPGPIDNPGHEAVEAALNPADGDWLYFVTVTEGDTRFTADYDEHLQNVEDFNEAQGNG